MRPWERAPVIEKYSSVSVLRDDLIEGGTKARIIPHLIDGAKELVYGGPANGAAAVALSVAGRELQIKTTLFYAERKELIPRQAHAKRNGAEIIGVPLGYITNVQKKARDYAEVNGALFLALGIDVPKAEPILCEFLTSVKKQLRETPEEVWCATSTGMMARCLAKVFSRSKIVGVTVGASRWHNKQDFPQNVELLPSGYKDLSQPVKHLSVPFPCCPNYEQKAWKLLAEAQQQRGKFPALFINVIGNQ